jgi:hypothetical protein
MPNENATLQNGARNLTRTKFVNKYIWMDGPMSLTSRACRELGFDMAKDSEALAGLIPLVAFGGYIEESRAI